MQSQILPSRAALVDRIALQFEYGQNLITLLGPSGLGKSYLLETFITDKYNDFNKAFVQLHARMTDQQLVSELLEQSFSAPLIDHELSLSENFYRLTKERSCGACLWVLDGGRHLSDEMAAELDRLAKQSPTTLYILVASQAVGQFTSAVEIHLEALNLAESKQLMKWYFTDLPIDEDPVYQAFLAEAQGNPSLLLGWQPVEHSAKVVNKDKVSWRVHLIALMLIIMLLIIGFLYKSDMTKLWQSYYQVESEPVIDTVLPVERVTQQSINQSQNTAAQEPQSQAAEALSETVQDEAAQVDVTSPVQDNNSNDHDGTLVDNDVSAILTSLTANSEIEKTSHVTTIASTLAATPKAVLRSVDNDWFLQQTDTKWVIQLLAVTKLADSEAFIRNNNLNQQQVKTYQTKRGDRLWWQVTYGNYSTLSEAKASLATLPSEVRKNKPFYKQISKIKQEIAVLDQ